MADRFTEVRLGELAYFEMGQSPSSTYVSEDEIGLPFLQGNAEFGAIFPTPKSYCSQPKKMCEPGDILISVRAPVGDLNKADQTYVIGRGLAAIRFAEIPPGFGWHLLNYWTRDLDRVAQGTTFKAISKGDLNALEVLLPPLSEQRRIAEILDAADEAIRQTERVIAKLLEVKQGLLHDLLTRGLDANGNLRGPDAHPEQFKDSPLGRIPRRWEVSTIRSCIEFITDYRGKTPPYSSEGIPAISAENIGDGRVKSITKYVTPEVYRSWLTRGYPLSDDVIFTTEAPVGEVALVPGDQTYLLTRRLMALRPDTTILRKHFLYWVLLRLKQLKMWGAFTHGSTVPRILKPDLLERQIPLPEIREQDAIVSILDAHGARIRAEEATLDKLRHIKRGLMDDLLTGRVRV